MKVSQYHFSKYCKYLHLHSWYVFVLVMCECVCYCAYFINVNKLYVHVCVLERAKHSFFALPNPLSCSVMNKICLNQSLTTYEDPVHIHLHVQRISYYPHLLK